MLDGIVLLFAEPGCVDVRVMRGRYVRLAMERLNFRMAREVGDLL